MQPIAVLHSPAFAHNGAAWSPFHEHKIAVAASANYGLIGNGKLQIASIARIPGQLAVQTLQPLKVFDTQDAIFGLAWSELHENHIVTGSGDGRLRLWDITLEQHPIFIWHEHGREVNSVDWSNVNKHMFCSASWDGTIRTWNPERPRSLQVISAHDSCIYQALFSPHIPDMIASCSTDGSVRMFDIRIQSGFVPPLKPVMMISAHNQDVLSIDWNKWQPGLLATASVDRSIKVWDTRMTRESVTAQPNSACLHELRGHEYAVRKVQWSNHSPNLLASASYDMTCRIWSTHPSPGQPPLQAIYDQHTEFAVGCSWSLHDPGLLMSSGWDCKTQIWRWR